MHVEASQEIVVHGVSVSLKVVLLVSERLHSGASCDSLREGVSHRGTGKMVNSATFKMEWLACLEDSPHCLEEERVEDDHLPACHKKQD